MQQFKAKFKNTPTGTPLVCSSTNSVLNRVEKLSVQDDLKNSKRALNNLEVDLLQYKGGQASKELPVITYADNLGRGLNPFLVIF